MEGERNRENIIAVELFEEHRPHEIAVVTEARPSFLPQSTLVQSEGRRALLYSREGLVPVARYGQGPGSVTLGELFALLTGYIRSLLFARDMLLDTRLLSSDPEAGVFICGDAATPVIKAIWGTDLFSSEGEKICRIARALAAHERVMGAKTSMERMTGIIEGENLSLAGCLKAAESICREWNQIVRAV
ncbi:MAG: hypothetical protein FWG03_06760 [Clostridiales bacterium]|nr:hypothetical protein [Clostridiales bacterium]